jgi:hypothetical protein
MADFASRGSRLLAAFGRRERYCFVATHVDFRNAISLGVA